MKKRRKSSTSRKKTNFSKTAPLRKSRKVPQKSDFLNVSIRIRPPLKRELNTMYQNAVKTKENTVFISQEFGEEDPSDIYDVHSFTYDKVYPRETTQEEVYSNTGKLGINSIFQGYNATIMAYGPTGSGKTHTMFQDPRIETVEPNLKKLGVIPRACEDIFRIISQKRNSLTKFLVRASYLQIYNEVITDLLDPKSKGLEIRESKKKGIYVSKLSEWVVRSPREIFHLINYGNKSRITSETMLNENSSRSHAVFQIILEQVEKSFYTKDSKKISLEEFKALPLSHKRKIDIHEQYSVGKLNCVDLAGSENVGISRVSKGIRFRETCNINKSLLTLGNVIRSLIKKNKKSYIPYRDSKLTRLLKDSLGGNCKTFLIGTLSPAMEVFHESLKTLLFVHQAKLIKNKPFKNEDIDQKALIRQYERELRNLRAELMKKERNVNVSKKILELEEQKKRAEEDKIAVLNLLENRSREFLHAKQDKRKLEEKIAKLESKLIHIGDDGAQKFTEVLQKERKRAKKLYEEKLIELEKERKSIEIDKVQVDRYKVLLIKQRDIMVALTNRLNSSHETIVELEDELEAYDKHIVNLEKGFDEQKKSMFELRKILINQMPIKFKGNIENIFRLYGIKNNISKELNKSIIQNVQEISEEENIKDSHTKITNINENEVDLLKKKLLLKSDVKRKELESQLEFMTNKYNIEKEKMNIEVKKFYQKEKIVENVMLILEKKSKMILDDVYKNIGEFYTNEKNKDKVILTKSLMLRMRKLLSNCLTSIQEIHNPKVKRKALKRKPPNGVL